jgi:pimeloyl-ACP methyl ester carboxylesterase
MLNLLGRSQRFCDGLSRRSFLKIGAFGAGLTLADMLRARAHANPTGSMSSQKAAIMIFLPGGPSHMDMWDLKPEAPVEYRGEFRPIATNVPGVQISEHFPRQARMWDKLACVRSIVSIDEHSDSLVMTGYSENTNRIAHHPSFG